MARVIHTGDTHLGYRQYHSPERWSDFLSAFRQVIRDAIDRDVDAVVHAGDLFHDRRPALSDIHGAISVLRELREAAIPFLAIVGNHERTRDGQWLDLFQTLDLATRLGWEPTVVSDVAFYGLDYVPRSKRDGLTYEFEPAPVDRTALVAHGLFTPFNTDWRIETVLQASSVDFDVVLLGDDHQPDTAEVDGTWITYCGSTERTSAAEREARGYNLVEFDGDVSIRRRGIETRPFVAIDIELGPGEGVDRVRDRVAEESLDDAVVVVSIEGEGEDIPVARIEEFATERGALIARVTDRREFEAAEIQEITFTDPDAAVRSRLRELGLSEAALAIDETIRGDVADATVRGRVKEHVTSLLEEEPAAFERIDEGAGEGPAPRDGEAADEADGADGATEQGDGRDGPDAPAAVADHEAGASPGAPDGDGEADDGGKNGPSSSEPTEGDGQATMEEYF